MVKLIASDMDGTLLDDEKQLPDDFFETLDGLLERNITFAVASGRTYSALEHLFPNEYVNRISYICDNGACVVHNGEVISSSVLEKSLYDELIRFAEQEDGFQVVACGRKGVYCKNLGKAFIEDVARYYKLHTIVDGFADIDDEFYKLAISDTKGSVVHGKPLLDRIFSGKINVQASGEEWMDVMPCGVSKGKALKLVQQILGADRSETMAFGDYFNDADMLALADLSFCMENGHEEIKKLCRYTAPNNNVGGVTDCIKRFVLN